MNWRQYYKEHLRTADEAVKAVKSGDRIIPSHAAGEPKYLMDALVRRKDELKNVEIWQGVNIGDAVYAKREYEGSFVVNSTFLGINNRSCIQEGRGEFTPISFSSFPRAIKDGFVKCDIFMGTVSPPDDMGYCSFGISVDMARACVENSRISIVLVNPNMPATCGDSKVHVTEIDYFVEADVPIYELSKADDSDEIVDQIGKNISNLIQDGDTLQIGIGNIPNAILKCLKDKKDLGVHTEVFTDNLIPLIEAGIINGSKKSINKRKIVSTFILGTRELYKFVHKNDIIMMRSVDYTNDIGVIAQNDNMVAINAALEIDLMGQVVADAIANKQFSGVGGQLDFIRGAAASVNGRPIIALPSTAKNGTISRISPYLKKGTPVTTTRNDVHWIATEYGIENMHGKNLTQRAKSLLRIAHPKFREELEYQFWNVIKESNN